MTTQTIHYETTGSKKATADYGRSSNGCGCGGSNCNSGSSCDATCGCNEGLLVQPQFFAGLLLDDDDLQAIMNYIVTSHRLHNRFVVGSGVSCGLAVTCHPCGQGKVIVQPGYAIDCCGRDIMVPCPVELDINAMARDLKFKRLGHDCGDPCADPAETNSGRKRNREDCDDPADRYCLYLRYCEQPTDPVAPYSQDESCSATCKPTRLREGFRFELRCPEEDEPPPSFVDRIRCCIGDLDEADFQSREFERSQHQVQRAKIGVEAFSLQQPAQFTKKDADLILSEQVQAELTKYETWLSDAESLKEKGSTNEAGRRLRDEKTLRHFFDSMQSLGPAIARYELLKVDEKESWEKKHEGLGKKISDTRDLWRGAKEPIKKKVPIYMTSSVEKAAAFATLDNTIMYTDPELGLDKRQTLEAYIYTHNAVSSPALAGQVNNALADFKNWLLRKMYQCPPTTECFLIEEVNSVVTPVGDNINETTIHAIDILVRAFIRYLLDCICSALIPPCPTCDDPAVKLACLEVKDCEVDNICNLERTFLLTEHNLRYWLPFLHGFGETLERLCCEFSKKFDKPIFRPRQDRIKATTQVQFEKQTGYFASGQQVSKSVEAQPAYPNLLRIAGLSADTVRPAINLSNSLVNLAARQPLITGLFMERDRAEAALEAGESTLEKVVESKPVRAAIKEEVGDQLSDFETRIESDIDDSLETTKVMRDRMNTKLSEVKGDLSKRLTTSKLPQMKVIKDLQASLDKQINENKTIVTRLEQLEKELKK